MLNCKETTRLLSETMDRKLNLKERMEVKVHTMMCKGCHNFGEQMQTLRDIARAYVGADAEPSDDDTDKA